MEMSFEEGDAEWEITRYGTFHSLQLITTCFAKSNENLNVSFLFL